MDVTKEIVEIVGVLEDELNCIVLADYSSWFIKTDYVIEDISDDTIYVDYTFTTNHEDEKIHVSFRINKKTKEIEINTYEDMYENFAAESFWRYLYFESIRKS